MDRRAWVGCSPSGLKELDTTEVTGACVIPQTGGILAMKQPCAGCWGFGLELGPAYPLEAWHQDQGTLNLIPVHPEAAHMALGLGIPFPE